MAGSLWLLAAVAQGQTTVTPVDHFEIKRFEVEGNSPLPAAKVARLLAAYTGPDRDFAAIRQAQEALEEAYHRAGYRLVRVTLPEQKVAQGVVRLQVVEAKIGRITVKGNQHFDEANIRASVPALREGATPDFNDISESLRVANESPAKKTTLQLQAASATNEVDATLDVKDEKPWVAGFSLDNTGDRITGRNRASLQYQNANIGGLDHVLSLQYTTSVEHPNEVSIFGAGYHVPLYALGDSLDLYASYSNVNSGTVSVGLFDLAVAGRGNVAGLRYNHYLRPFGDYESKLVAGLDYKDFKNNVSLAGIPLGSDVIVHPFSLTYTGDWRPKDNTFSYYLSGIQNIPGGDNGSTGALQMARAGATANYWALRYGAAWVGSLPADWQLHFTLNGQYTTEALVATEQFGIGGVATVRGFEEREIADDKGYATESEFYTPELCSGGVGCRLLAFYDTGYVSHDKGLPGEKSHQSIASTGFGGRATLSHHASLQADFAHVVDGSSTTPKGSNRVLFRLMLLM